MAGMPSLLASVTLARHDAYRHMVARGFRTMNGRKGRARGHHRDVPFHRKACVVPSVCRLRVIILLSSRTHRTELASAAQMSQSVALKRVVENASCRTGM